MAAESEVLIAELVPEAVLTRGEQVDLQHVEHRSTGEDGGRSVASGDQDGVYEGHDDDQVIKDHDVHTIPVGDWLDRALMEGDPPDAGNVRSDMALVGRKVLIPSLTVKFCSGVAGSLTK